MFFKWTQDYKIKFLKLMYSWYVLLCGPTIESLLLRGLGIRTHLIWSFPWLAVPKEEVDPEAGLSWSSSHPSLVEQWGLPEDARQYNHLFIYSFYQQIFIESLQRGARC